jgi:putative FmdB family regulatory protein
MPTYDYVCRSCDHELEVFQPITARPKRKCPSCGRSALERRIGTGAGILFRGTGFYQTDYRSPSYTQGQKAESGAAESKPAEGRTAGSPPASAAGGGSPEGRSTD